MTQRDAFFRSVVPRGPSPGSLILALLLVTGSALAPAHGQLFRRWNAGSPETQDERSNSAWDWFRPTPTETPAVYPTLPPQAKLIADLNARAVRIQQLGTTVSIKIDAAGSPKIKGSLQVEFPKRMRLKAGVMGVSELGIDAGSNDDQFWVWSKVNLPNQPPAMYFAEHEAFKTSPLRRQIPLEPQWLMDAFGILFIDPRGEHFGPFPESEPGWFSLYTRLPAPVGQPPQTRKLLINSQTGRIEQIAIYGASKQRLAYANASRFRRYDDYEVDLPQRVELHITQTETDQLDITFDLGNYDINALYGDPQRMWSMPNAEGVPKYDLGRQAPGAPASGARRWSQLDGG